MRIQRLTIAGTCGLLAITAAADADPARADADEVVAKVEQAIELIRSEGDMALPVLADPSGGFVWKDTYVFVVNCEADRVIVNPAFPERIGGDIKQHTDYAGWPYGKELCRIANTAGGGWIEYTWLRPGDDTPRRKTSYVRSVPGMPYQVGAGIYEDEERSKKIGEKDGKKDGDTHHST